MEPWTKKYLPKFERDMIGQKNSLKRVQDFLVRYKPGDKPLILAGPTGCGKTSLVYVAAPDREIIEVNASDTRNKASIEQLVGAAAKQQSLFFKGKIILIDEVDSVSGVKDRGAIPSLVSLIKESHHPLIFTANDIESQKLKPLRKASEIVMMEHPGHEHITARLSEIAKKEKVNINQEHLTLIARRSGGDVRAAINDLQSLGDNIEREDVDFLSERERTEPIEQALLRVFKTTNASVSLPAFDSIREDPDKLMLWIDENLPREYKKPEDLARAFDALAEADKFFGRIRKWQYYRYYVYVYNLITAGISLSKESKYPGATKYKQTSRLLKIWIYNRKNQKKNRLAEQLAPQIHTSKKRVVKDVLPYIKMIYKNKKGKNITERYGLDEDATEWLMK